MNTKRAFLYVAGVIILFAGLNLSSLLSKPVLANPLEDLYTYLPLILKQEPPPPPPPPPPSGVQILSNHSYFIDDYGYTHIVGEVLNNTGDHLEFVKITANFFNSSGQFVGSDYTYTYLWYLPAWDKTCFSIWTEAPPSWSYYQFEAPTYWTDGQPLPNLTVLDDSGLYNSYYGWYEIIGLVRNDHGSRVEYVQPVGTLYNVSGTVVDCDFTFVNSTHLDPGQTSSFELTFYWGNYSDVTSYRLQVDGNP
jgi:hypothetical protein